MAAPEAPAEATCSAGDSTAAGFEVFAEPFFATAFGAGSFTGAAFTADFSAPLLGGAFFAGAAGAFFAGAAAAFFAGAAGAFFAGAAGAFFAAAFFAGAATAFFAGAAAAFFAGAFFAGAFFAGAFFAGAFFAGAAGAFFAEATGAFFAGAFFAGAATTVGFEACAGARLALTFFADFFGAVATDADVVAGGAAITTAGRLSCLKACLVPAGFGAFFPPGRLDFDSIGRILFSAQRWAAGTLAVVRRR